MPKKITMPSAATIKADYAASGAKAATNYGRAIATNSTWFGQATSDLSEQHYGQGVQVAVAEKRRSTGIKTKTTQQGWQTAAISKGQSVLATRISGAADKQAANYAPYYSALAALEIQDKTPGDPLGNLQRNAGRVVATLVNVKRTKEGVAPIQVP
jgi:hypothetical protein